MLATLVAAFLNSWRGLSYAAKTERAVRQELLALALALPAALVLSGDWWIRVALVGVILLILAVELLNTAVEKLCDRVHPQQDLRIGQIKDLASAAVLCTLALGGIVWGVALLQRLGG